MNVEYKITEYFEKNNLFDCDSGNGLMIKNEGNSLLINGNSRDLIELADLLTSLALEKNREAHLHVDDLTLLNNQSDFSDLIIDKN